MSAYLSQLLSILEADMLPPSTPAIETTSLAPEISSIGKAVPLIITTTQSACHALVVIIISHQNSSLSPLPSLAEPLGLAVAWRRVVARAERQTDLLGHEEVHLLAEGGMTTPITKKLGDGVVDSSVVLVGRHVVRLGREKKVLGVVW